MFGCHVTVYIFVKIFISCGLATTRKKLSQKGLRYLKLWNPQLTQRSVPETSSNFAIISFTVTALIYRYPNPNATGAVRFTFIVEDDTFCL
jgi:hypothetical protein